MELLPLFRRCGTEPTEGVMRRIQPIGRQDWLLITDPAGSIPVAVADMLILTAAAILMFLLNLRRAGERLDARETNMPSTARYLTPPPAALLIAMLWLTRCAMGSSDAQAPCPPVVDYSVADQTRAADEVEARPEGTVIARMLGDYTVLRDQARASR